MKKENKEVTLLREIISLVRERGRSWRSKTIPLAK